MHDAVAEQKAKKSRKSVAYHKAMAKAKSEGKELEVCKQEAKAVSCMCIYHSHVSHACGNMCVHVLVPCDF